MSLKSWRAEFYPVSAKKAQHDTFVALQHAKLLWSGLTPENLAKHDVLEVSGDLRNKHYRGNFQIDASTCSLCERYLLKCSDCPLTRVRGVACHKDKGWDISPYHIWLDKGNPKPMIWLINKAIARHQAQQAKETVNR